MKNRKRSTKLALALAGLLFTAGISQASVVNNWNMSNVTPVAPTAVANPDFVFDQFNYIEPGSLVDPNTGEVAVNGFMPSGWAKYAVGSVDLPNGAMTWKERDTQGPGLSVVTGDDVKGENCIMSAGWNPSSTPAATLMSDWWGIDLKQCSDPWQSSKRFKMVSRVVDGPVDLTFDVTNTGSEDIYRILQKYGNHTGSRITGYTQQLGFIVNGQFIEAQPGQGLAFSLKNGTKFDNNNPTPSSMANQGELDSLMAHGLFGAPDKHHTSAGYFNPYTRGNFGLSAGETFITTTGLSPVHTDLFGEWLPADQMKGAYYFDMDSNPYTDNALVASCDGVLDEEGGRDGTAPNAGCDGTWITYRESVNVTQNPDGTWNIPPAVGTDVRAPIPVSQADLDAWAAHPDWAPGYIDDLANVNINAYVVVGDASGWPTADGNGNAQFTIRMTPTFDASVAATEPGTDGPADFVVSITAPTSVQ